ncbi:response regulator [Frigoriglobus tundricola]|uniref:Chemotaxis protein methyltransferase CheR n=1 Tax=Frigoriglobus tundricola TaxID=2774151 RepID=A0A6M5Z535_9BACT|nr:response regulator [Frigoriglobus tundricola]QJX00642.1 Chemotaxis protein methyltransferase CheR [Frigoriglobus tundricola]
MSPGPVTLRVLVVDDNRDAADTLADLLRLYGADVRACYSAETALAQLGTFDFQAAILDIHMPGVDGCELAQRLRAATPARLLLVALTGVSDDAARRRTAEAGFDLHLTKASASDILVAALAAFGRWLVENRPADDHHFDDTSRAPN